MVDLLLTHGIADQSLVKIVHRNYWLGEKKSLGISFSTEGSYIFF
jgi:hypothetical protein